MFLIASQKTFDHNLFTLLDYENLLYMNALDQFF